MTRPHRLYVGTIGEGLWRSTDGGASFVRVCRDIFVECHVRALSVHPDDPARLLVGTELGLFQSDDGADHWRRVESPANDRQIWSVLRAPRRPRRVVVGACPSQLFVSDDDGRTWVEPAAAVERRCPGILHTRVTTLKADPDDADLLWAGVEIDGVHHSRDGGRTWQPLAGTGLSSRDIHDLVVVPANGRAKGLLASTNNDLNWSEDGGATWQPLRVGEVLPWSYCRGMTQLCGRPEVILLGNGDAPPGTVGVVARSADGGRTWGVTRFPGRANSTVWSFAVHPADPDLVYASSVSGQLFRSTDGGAGWEKLPREFGEIRALAWTP